MGSSLGVCQSNCPMPRSYHTSSTTCTLGILAYMASAKEVDLSLGCITNILHFFDCYT